MPLLCPNSVGAFSYMKRNSKGQFVKGHTLQSEWKGIFINCKTCNKEFYCKPYEVIANKKFCSCRCYWKDKKGKPSSRKGIKLSKKQIEANRQIMLKWWKKLENRKKQSLSHKGYKASKETKKKMSESRKGDKHWNWKNGISCEPYSSEWTKVLKHSIRIRDFFTCKICEKRGWVVHHIDYNKKNCDPNNLITLCSSCHSKTNYKREYWIKFFNNN